MTTVKIVNKSSFDTPFYATEKSAGMDIKANIEEPIVLRPLQRTMVPTGLYIALPEGTEAQIRPRSGLAAKHGITVLNTPGTIDADYRGEIKVILVNLSNDDFTINRNTHYTYTITIKGVNNIELEVTTGVENQSGATA